MQTDLVARLRADIGISALVASTNSRPAIDYVTRPDGAVLPSVTITDVVGDPIYIMSGRQGSVQATVQFDIWSATPLQGIQVADRIVEIMESEATHGSTFFHRAFISSGPRQMRAEDLEGGQRVHRRSVDLQFFHKPV